MPRNILADTQLHAAIAPRVAEYKNVIVNEVQQAMAQHNIVVVGMAQNPFVKKARKALQAKNISFHYLEYGNYWSRWKDRLALKMWSGWPTFPMVFVRGTLIGGADDLARLITSGEVK